MKNVIILIILIMILLTKAIDILIDAKETKIAMITLTIMILTIVLV